MRRFPPPWTVEALDGGFSPPAQIMERPNEDDGELEFESVGETTHNAMDQALIRGLEALKKGIELRETGTPRRTIKTGSAKWNIVEKALS